MFYPILFENPNSIYIKDLEESVEWYNSIAIPFSYYGDNDDIVVGKDGETHTIINPHTEYIGGRGRLSGRIFESYFIITFWDFPKDQAELKKVIEDLSNNPNSSHLDFSDSRWKIEIPFDTSRPEDSYIPSFIINWGTWAPDENSQIFVKLNDYNGANPRSIEELKQGHILSPLEKNKNTKNTKRGFGSDKTAWDSSRNIKVRQSELTSESLSDRYYPTLFENPNAIYLNDYHTAVNWTNIKSLAFSYYNDIMYVGSIRSTHIDLYKNARIKDNLAEIRNGRGKYAGRLFVSPKIISFWDFPETYEIFKQLLKDIEEETSIRFDNTWKVEIPLYYQKDPDGYGGWGSWYPRQSSQKFININDYDGGFARSEQEMRQEHVMTPIEKERLKNKNNIARGFGSDKTAWDSPHNIKTRQQKQTSESLIK